MKNILPVVFCLWSVCAFASRNETVSLTTAPILPGASLTVAPTIVSHHINIHKISVAASSVSTKSRIDVYKKNTFLPVDRVYTRLFTGSFNDPDGVIRTEGFVIPYEDADAASHAASKELHLMIANESNSGAARTFTVTILYEAIEGPSGMLDVKQFGAVGDGITDDTDAIQRAVTEGVAFRKTVFVPVGRYRITSSITFETPTGDPGLQRNSFSITGTGIGSVLVNHAPPGNSTLKLIGKQQFHISDLAFLGHVDHPNEAIFIGETTGGIRSGYGSIKDLDLYPYGNGIHIQGTNTVSIDRVRYWNGGLYEFEIGTPIDPSVMKHAVIADGATAVNDIHIDSLYTNNWATIAGGGAAIKWATVNQSDTISISNSSLEGADTRRSIDFHKVFFFNIDNTYFEGAEVKLTASRHGFIKGNYRGQFKIGDGTSANACAYITAFGSSGARFEADQESHAVRVIGGLFDQFGYDNASQNRVTLNVYDEGSLLLPDELGAAGIKERGRSTPIGEWINPPYDSADFTAETGNWIVDPGDVQKYSYTLVGKTMTVNFFIAGTDVTGGPTRYLQIRIPGGYLPKGRVAVTGSGANNGGATTNISVEVIDFTPTIFIARGSFGGTLGDWMDGSGNFVTGSVTFEVQ